MSTATEKEAPVTGVTGAKSAANHHTCDSEAPSSLIVDQLWCPNFDSLVAITGNKLGVHDLPCPICSHLRHTAANRKRPVLRVWRRELNFISYYCARCGAHCYARVADARPLPSHQLRTLMRAADEAQVAHVIERRRRARWLWQQAVPIEGNACRAVSARPRHSLRAARDAQVLASEGCSSVSTGRVFWRFQASPFLECSTRTTSS